MNVTINRLPAYTYNWLHMNEANLRDVPALEAAEVRTELPEGVLETSAQCAAEIETGAGADMDALVAASGGRVRTFTVPAGVRVTDDALRLYHIYADQGFVYEPAGESAGECTGCLNAYQYILEPEAELTVVMDYSAAPKAGGLAAVQTKIHAKQGSVLRLVQIQRFGEDYTLINDIGGLCEEGARIEVIRLILGAKHTYDGCRVALAGERSALDVEIGYLATGDAMLDMNYDAYHTGRRTVSVMNVSGVLRDRASKLFRGTIDFQNGCSGAVGDELEDVLLMDSTVVNRTIPLILCAEEDVVGNHGATIGRLDEQLLFYMESRGMKRDEIYEMMARARIDTVIRKIPDEKTRSALLPEAEK